MSDCAFGQSGLQRGPTKRKWLGPRHTGWAEKWEGWKDR